MAPIRELTILRMFTSEMQKRIGVPRLQILLHILIILKSWPSGFRQKETRTTVAQKSAKGTCYTP
jgi:hypothetical protein